MEEWVARFMYNLSENARTNYMKVPYGSFLHLDEEKSIVSATSSKPIYSHLKRNWSHSWYSFCVLSMVTKLSWRSLFRKWTSNKTKTYLVEEKVFPWKGNSRAQLLPVIFLHGIHTSLRLFVPPSNYMEFHWQSLNPIILDGSESLTVHRYSTQIFIVVVWYQCIDILNYH